MAVDVAPPPPSFGFQWSNARQLGLHVAMAVLIGVTLRLTTFEEATTAIADAVGHKYVVKTSFLVSFGFTKALSNLVVGRLSDLYGRQLPHAVGWGFGVLLGVALLGLAWNVKEQQAVNAAEKNNSNHLLWFFYVLANVLLGAQQGWTWTTNIFMFLDILGPSNRAVASAISNSVGYLTSAATTYLAAVLSTKIAFGAVLACSLLGCIVSTCCIQDTSLFVVQEETVIHQPTPLQQQEMVDFQSKNNGQEDVGTPVDKDGSTHDVTPEVQTSLVDDEDPTTTILSSSSSMGSVFVTTCWQNPSAAVLCWGGLTANLITSLAWGLVLIWGHQQDLTALQLASIGSAFTLAKGVTMITSGYCSDRMRRRKVPLVGGYLLAALGLVVTAGADDTDDLSLIYSRLWQGGIIIGCGIGIVYCVLTAALSDHTPPNYRASAIGVYKLWRDSGYAFGGLLTGWIADASGGSFVTTTTVVAGLVMVLVVFILVFYREIAT